MVGASITWKRAVLDALQKYSEANNTAQISREKFIDSELSSIVANTNSIGKTPSQTLSRVLQELRDEGQLFFSSNGLYLLNTSKFDAADEDFAQDSLENAISLGNLTFKNINTSSKVVQRRQRVGVAALRDATLKNYSFRCALCDIADKSLLVTSHIARWADFESARGRLDNTICFCNLHDKLFENGYFVLTDDLKPLFRLDLNSRVLETWKNKCTFEFALPIKNQPNIDFLKMHRERVNNFYGY